MKSPLRTILAATAAAGLLLAAACSPAEPPDESGTVLTIAAVDNIDIERLRDLSAAFTEQHPDVTLEWVMQTENEIRQTISTDVGTQAGRFDIVTVGTYEAEVWADRGFLTPLTDMPAGFDPGDFIPTMREALSHDGELLAAPFYGESVFTMYRTDIFEQAGLEMPEQPTWEFILDTAAQLSEAGDVAPLCFRRQPGWGQNVAPLSAMAHANGARWFDDDWNAQLDSPEWTQVFEDYVTLARYAPGDHATSGFQENLELFAGGQCAIWVDTTSAASSVVDPQTSEVAGDVAFTYAPRYEPTRPTSWLWSWALAIPGGSPDVEHAKEFIVWATSQEYTELAAREYGWSNVPPGTRTDLYQNSNYIEAAAYAPLVLEAIEGADVMNPAAMPVPYVGIQYVAVPAFQSIGTAVGQQLTNAITGDTPLPEAQENAQWVTREVIQQARMTDESDED